MGADVSNHHYGADFQIGRPIRWRFVVGHGKQGRHECSPGIEGRLAVQAARQVAIGRVDLARVLWGVEVCAWLDERGAAEKEALISAAREVGEAFSGG